MAIQMEPIEVLEERWERGCTRAVREALTSAQTHQQIAQAVSFYTGNVRTVSRRAGQSGQIVLPSWTLEKLGVKIGDSIVLEPTERNTVELRRLTEDDLPEIARAAIERAGRLLPARQPEREVKHFDKRCEQCGEPYRARRAYQKFCPSCGQARKKAATRAYERSLRDARAGPGRTVAEKTMVPR